VEGDIGGVASLDDDIEDQAALAGGQVELVSVLNLTAALADDVGVRPPQGWPRSPGRRSGAGAPRFLRGTRSAASRMANARW
jgi:hypothetical protein